MISTKKLVKMARKWQKLAAIRRKRISLPRKIKLGEANLETTVADEGHFAVYTADRMRFVIPLAYLSNIVFRELLRTSKEEFGLPSDGPITLPYDAFLLEYTISLIQRGVAEDLEKALLTSFVSSNHSLLSSSSNSYTGAQTKNCLYTDVLISVLIVDDEH